jgi:hypothetical protein
MLALKDGGGMMGDTGFSPGGGFASLLGKAAANQLSLEDGGKDGDPAKGSKDSQGLSLVASKFGALKVN